MHHCERQVSSSRSVSDCNPATRRTLTPVSNFLQTYQIAASAATPSCLSGTQMTLPSLREVCHLVFVWTLCCPASSLLSAFESDHRFPTICGSRAALHPLVYRSRFCLFTVAVSFPTLYTKAPTALGASTRSFQCSGTDRPSRTICSSQSADSKSRCVQSSKHKLALRLPLLDAV